MCFKKLIVNADDFGYTTGINQGIIAAHVRGIVTSTSVMVTEPAATKAKTLNRFPNLSVGLHLHLKEKSLEKDVIELKQLSPAVVDRLATEFEKQIYEFQRLTGQLPTHLDSHHNIHFHPQIMGFVTHYASNLSIPVRNARHTNLVRDFYGRRDPNRVSGLHPVPQTPS